MSTSSTSPLIHARELTKRFGSFTAVDAVDFDVQPGEAFGFLGPNGAGKTSTMRMIGCISPVTDGSLEVLGLDPRHDGSAIRRRLGVVPRVVLEWSDHPGRLSRSHPAYTLDAFVRCRVHHLPRLHPRARDGVVVCGAGPVGKTFSRALRAEGIPLLAFVDVDPRKVGQRIHGVPVLAHGELDDVLGAFFLSAVAGARGRASVRRTLAGHGLEEGRDFVAVA